MFDLVFGFVIGIFGLESLGLDVGTLGFVLILVIGIFGLEILGLVVGIFGFVIGFFDLDEGIIVIGMDDFGLVIGNGGGARGELGDIFGETTVGVIGNGGGARGELTFVESTEEVRSNLDSGYSTKRIFFVERILNFHLDETPPCRTCARVCCKLFEPHARITHNIRFLLPCPYIYPT